MYVPIKTRLQKESERYLVNNEILRIAQSSNTIYDFRQRLRDKIEQRDGEGGYVRYKEFKSVLDNVYFDRNNDNLKAYIEGRIDAIQEIIFDIQKDNRKTQHKIIDEISCLFTQFRICLVTFFRIMNYIKIVKNTIECKICGNCAIMDNDWIEKSEEHIRKKHPKVLPWRKV